MYMESECIKCSNLTLNVAGVTWAWVDVSGSAFSSSHNPRCSKFRDGAGCHDCIGKTQFRLGGSVIVATHSMNLRSCAKDYVKW